MTTRSESWRCPTCDESHTDLQWQKATLVGWAGGTMAVRLTTSPDAPGLKRERVLVAVEIRKCQACETPMGRERELPMAVKT